MRQAHIIIALLLLMTLGGNIERAQAQQVYQFSQYLQNLYILNSASAGVEDCLEINTSMRKQWVGIQNSPNTNYISASMPIGKRLEVKPKSSSVRISKPTSYNEIKRKAFHAFGVFVAQDSYGPYTENIASVSYAYHLPLSEELTLSFSPNVSFNSMSFDQTKAQVELSGDGTYANYVANRNQSSAMDINVAFWLYHYRFFAGYSSSQLLQDRLKISSDVTLEKLKAHHNLILGYNFHLKRGMVLTPSSMLKYVDQAPLAADFNVRLEINERYWCGVSYRNSNALAGMLGLYLSNTLRLGYSFDFALSSLQLQNVGSHEIMLGLNLINKEKAIF